MPLAFELPMPPVPRYVAKTSDAAPDWDGSIFATNASPPLPAQPAQVVSNDAPASGKSVAVVKPVRYALPAASIAIASAWSAGKLLPLKLCAPPRYVE